MTSDDIIREGDKVAVYWDHVNNIFDAEVLFAPKAFGEPWILRENNGTIHYVMVFSRMTMNRRSVPVKREQI